MLPQSNAMRKNKKISSWECSSQSLHGVTHCQQDSPSHNMTSIQVISPIPVSYQKTKSFLCDANDSFPKCERPLILLHPTIGTSRRERTLFHTHLLLRALEARHFKKHHVLLIPIDNALLATLVCVLYFPTDGTVTAVNILKTSFINRRKSSTTSLSWIMHTFQKMKCRILSWSCCYKV